MPRSINALALAQAIADNASRTHLVELQFSAGTVRWTTAPVNLSWNGFTWTAIGGALAIGEITETVDAAGGGVTLTLGGVDPTIIATILTNNPRGRLAEVRLAFVNPTTTAIVADPILQFRGFMNAEFSIEEERPMKHSEIGSVKVSTRLVPRMIQINRTRPLACDELTHQRIVGFDTFFRPVGSLTGRTVLWGRAAAVGIGSQTGYVPVPGMGGRQSAGYNGSGASGGGGA